MVATKQPLGADANLFFNSYGFKVNEANYCFCVKDELCRVMLWVEFAASKGDMDVLSQGSSTGCSAMHQIG